MDLLNSKFIDNILVNIPAWKMHFVTQYLHDLSDVVDRLVMQFVKHVWFARAECFDLATWLKLPNVVS